MTALEMLEARRAALFAKEIGINSLNKGDMLNSAFANLARDCYQTLCRVFLLLLLSGKVMKLHIP